MDVLEELAKQFPDTSKSSLRKMITQGRVKVGRDIIKKNLELSPKQIVTVLPKKRFRDQLTIYYEDEHIVVVEKPEGLLSVDTDKRTEPSMHTYLKREFSKVWPVQRLDRETSGVMVFALSDEAKEGLKVQFMTHEIYREYYGIVQGELIGAGTWESKLLDDKNFVVRVHPEGELAITHFSSLKKTKATTKMKFVLKTGKKNQIRVHAAEAGHPILGDKKYGSGELTIGRLALHAHKLGFDHPITGKRLFFISPKPF